MAKSHIPGASNRAFIRCAGFHGAGHALQQFTLYRRAIQVDDAGYATHDGIDSTLVLFMAAIYSGPA